MNSPTVRSLTAVALGFIAAGSATAQPNPYYPGPGYYQPPIYGPGGVLQGQAQVLQASGQLAIDNESTRMMRQKLLQEKMVTKKQALDLANYERANTPTYTDEQRRNKDLIFQRMMVSPAPPEITRGDTLNTFMPVLKMMADDGVPGPPMSISPAILKQINVGTGTSGGDTKSAGMLKDGGKLMWPLTLRGPNQKKLDSMVPKAIEDAVAGTLEPKTYTQMLAIIQTMTEENRKAYHKDQMSSMAFIDGKHYLEDLTKALKVLQEPDPGKYFGGGYSHPQGHNVQELVQNMSATGLKFAPASPGGEAAYFAMHDAFVAYARAGQSGGSIQTSLTAPAPPGPGKKGTN